MGFAKDDLILRRPERIKEWKERFGDIKLLFLGDDDMTKEKLLELNKEYRKNIKK